ncbi:MAG: hypothetical protein JRI96_07445 [Deltaproteobacteria bacterium]|nr:hypothetical protein [Deltaproteobacteria bacterium]
MKKIFCLIFLTTLLGCTPVIAYQRITSGVIGCPPSDIEISNIEPGYFYGIATWTAKCNGKTYICSEGKRSLNCKELEK